MCFYDHDNLLDGEKTTNSDLNGDECAIDDAGQYSNPPGPYPERTSAQFKTQIKIYSSGNVIAPPRA